MGGSGPKSLNWQRGITLRLSRASQRPYTKKHQIFWNILENYKKLVLYIISTFLLEKGGAFQFWDIAARKEDNTLNEPLFIHADLKNKHDINNLKNLSFERYLFMKI